MTKEFDFNPGHVIPNRHCVVVFMFFLFTFPAHNSSGLQIDFFFLLLAVGEGTPGVTVPYCELER